jgi:hypothetical protein
MVMIHDCIPCQYGDHDGHIDVPGPVPEGLIGGWRCDCKGECRDRPRPEPKYIEDTTDYGALAAELGPLMHGPRAFRERHADENV